MEVDAFTAIKGVFKEKPEWEAAIPKEGFAHRPVDMEEWARKGKEMKQRLWGAEAATVDAAAQSLAPDFMELADAYLYGGVWQLPGLDLKQKLYCVISALTALGNQAQLRRYIKAALRVGVTRQEVEEVLVQCSGYAGLSASLNALATAKAIFDEGKG
ncbi:MAG: carboxymuconolactone decarboxylase family protein [Dehalococcoidia bacterium]|nr:carboxymuconolactone decarboxylase family protein [Dehalococcoidia bacterium]